jgi:N-acetylmuramoyl-L-alanine amidase
MGDPMENIRRGSLEAGQKAAQAVVFFCIVAAVGLLVAVQPDAPQVTSTPSAPTSGATSAPIMGGATPPPPTDSAPILPTMEEGGSAAPTDRPKPTRTPGPTPTRGPTPTPTPYVPRVGIVAGHWWLDEDGQQSLDVGAVCDEDTPYELTELEINLDVAQRVVYELQRMGYEVDLLQEWDDRLYGYQADVLLSIHADACLYPEASGFKAARVVDSHLPEVEDRLVACIVESYGARTGLTFHEGSITYDMTYNHTFYEIDPNTPGAIIEVGFMLADRLLLTGRPDLVAQGIIDGILCFLEGEGITLE